MHDDPLCWLRVFVCVTLYAADDGGVFCFWYPLPLGFRLGKSKRAKKAGDAMRPLLVAHFCCFAVVVAVCVTYALPISTRRSERSSIIVAAKKTALQLFPSGYRPQTDVQPLSSAWVSWPRPPATLSPLSGPMSNISSRQHGAVVAAKETRGSVVSSSV